MAVAGWNPAEYSMRQQSRRDDMMRNILNMFMQKKQFEMQDRRYQDQTAQQKTQNEMAQEKFNLEKQKFTSDKEYQATRIPYLEAMTKEAEARATKLSEPTARKSYAPKTVYEVSKTFGMSPDEFNTLDPTRQDDYFGQYWTNKRSNISDSREDTRRNESTLTSRKSDLKEISKYYDNRSIGVGDEFKSKMLKDPMYMMAREPGKRKVIEGQYDELAKVEMYKVKEAKKEAIYNLVQLYPDYYKLAENKETGETIVALPDGSFFSVGTFKK